MADTRTTAQKTAKATARTILRELEAVVDRLADDQVDALVDALLAARKIVVIGVGREGLTARAFTMRLMHCGLDAHWVWDDTAPALGADDLLLAVSGSGEIGHIDYVARQAMMAGARLAVVTADPEAQTADMADVVLRVPGAAYSVRSDVVPSVQPMGSLFEQACWLVLDTVVLELVSRAGLRQEDLSARHRNVE